MSKNLSEAIRDRVISWGLDVNQIAEFYGKVEFSPKMYQGDFKAYHAKPENRSTVDQETKKKTPVPLPTIARNFADHLAVQIGEKLDVEVTKPTRGSSGPRESTLEKIDAMFDDDCENWQ